MGAVEDPLRDATGAAYAERLESLAGARWKRWLDVQAPYRWHLRRLRLGRVLDVGCGIGRNLLHLGGHGVGVDANARAVERARARGLVAYTPEAFASAPEAAPAAFDALLCAHVIEHMTFAEAAGLLRGYLPYLRPGGRVVLITPQEAGFRSDPSHVEAFDFAKLAALLAELRLAAERSYSFPLPRPAGRVFLHNEFVALARKAG
jgi:2-polyprenyl-3-methyl-5-hydroxy-6-metoxy-1,4-benzoquinol methylase